MPVEAGKAYYFIAHAYHHFIGRVREVTGKREADVGPSLRVQSCQRGWTEFFRDGLGRDTSYAQFPPGSITWIAAFEWPHPFPGDEEAPRAAR